MMYAILWIALAFISTIFTLTYLTRSWDSTSAGRGIMRVAVVYSAMFWLEAIRESIEPDPYPLTLLLVGAHILAIAVVGRLVIELHSYSHDSRD